ncbi:hypothetical protein V8D89_011460 [Ganoderma adspersum]
MNVDEAVDGVQDDSISEKAGSEDYISRKMKEKNSSPQAAVDTPEQKKLREQIAYHENKIIRLKQALNSQRPTIAKLPPEILAEIFLHQAAVAQRERVVLHEEKGGAEIHKSFYEWTNVAQVCHHWRDVALQCPHVSSRLTDTIAERSHQLPLTIVLAIDSLMTHCEVCLDPDGQCQYPDTAFWMVNQKLPRVRDLVILIDREMDRMFGTVLDIWDPILETPAQLLENLRIEATGPTRYTQEDSNKPAELNTPKLHLLTFGGVGVRFTNPLFCSTLRRLKIEECQCWRPSTQPDFNAWLLALKRLTHLEVLEVDWSIPSANGEIEYQPVSVPKLKYLHLKTTVAVFLDHMNAAVRFSCADANLLDQARISSFHEATSSLFERLSVYCVSPGDSQLLWGSDKSSVKPSTKGPTSPPSPPKGPPPRLTFDSKLDTLDIPLIFGALDLSHVHTIHVADFPSGNEWARVLKNALNVTALYAHGMAALGLPAILAGGIANDLNLETAFSAIDTNAILPNDCQVDEDRGTPDAPSEEGSTASESLFPSLRALTFISVDFLLAASAARDAHRVTNGDLLAFEERGLEYGFDVEALVESLRMRQAQGAADINCVEFVNCLCADMAQLASLVVTVPEVKWDGKRVVPASFSS